MCTGINAVLKIITLLALLAIQFPSGAYAVGRKSQGSEFPFVAPPQRRDDGSFIMPSFEAVRQAYALAGWIPLNARAPYVAHEETINLYGKTRSFNLSGDQPFVNPTTGQSDIAVIQADGQLITGAKIESSGFPPYVTKVFDQRIAGAYPVVKVTLRPEDRLTAGSWRTQIANYPLQPYRTYSWVLCFRLDDAWDLDSSNQAGLVWQLKGQPKPGQYGNPVIALNLDRNELYCSILYPATAFRQPWGSTVQWGKGEYKKVSLPRRRIENGRYYLLQMEFFTDDRPQHAGGHGYFRANLDGAPWIDYVGPTLHPDQAGPHQPTWGWYQWGGKPKSTRTVWWLNNEGYSKD